MNTTHETIKQALQNNGENVKIAGRGVLIEKD